MTEVSLPAVRLGPGRIALRLEPHERRILGSVVGELAGELRGDEAMAPDGALARLFPPAFPDDAAAQAEWAEMVHADLRDDRVDRVAVVEATIDADVLDEAQASAWLGVLNDARLVLGDSLGITEDASDEAGQGASDPAEDPDAMRRAVFGYLGWLVGAFTDALAEGLPDVPDDTPA
jgi:hypothetical protein